MIYLIAGLGNPTKAYENTRHNVGFMVVDALAKQWGWKFQKKERLRGFIAHGLQKEKTVILLKPFTYMNISGEAVMCTTEYFKVDVQNILVIVDDVAIPFGEFRMKKESGSGGHKGLESVALHLKTNAYNRFRFGIGGGEKKDLAPYVLDPFTQEEKKALPALIEQTIKLIEVWVEEGLEKAMNLANLRKHE